ncbi:MAG: hypothetical protein HQL26_09100 [Candidatus Omnitrophica bacterium]|nr:hypothetical protein [Candidatus Omnitrophota bacterium]
MKKIILMLCVLAFTCSTAFAFLFEGKVMTREEIKQLTDDALLQTYTDIMIEKRANEAFHANSGYSPKEYENYKVLLTYVVNLRQEMANRKIDPPAVGEWLK